MKNKPTYIELEKQIEILKSKSAQKEVDKSEYVGELVISNKEYASLNEEYLTQNEEIKATNDELKQAKFVLNERLKELNCLYGISKIIEIPDISIEEILPKVISLVPASWQYPEIAVCRIIIDGIEYKKPNFKKTDWMQSSNIKVDGKNVGIIEICYLEKMPDIDQGPFLKEERLLIDAVAERIGHVIERKQAEEALQINEKKLNQIINSSPIGICTVDMLGNFITTNPEYEQMVGYSKEELVGLSFFDVTHPNDHPKNKKLFQDMFSLETTDFFMEKKYIRKNGEEINVFVNAIGIRDAEGNVKFGTAFVDDITERKQAELELQKSQSKLKTQNDELIISKDKAEESDRLKSAFLANMSHEIRTPMNGIMGFSKLLKEPGLSGDEQEEYITIIESSGERMLNIINDIISISKIESGLMEVNIQESNINKQIEYIYNFFKNEIEKKGMQLTYKNSLPLNEAIIETDREKVFAILTNLVKNAIKYSEKGSIEIGYITKGKYIEFYVKDTGIGVLKDRQKAIFERFIQADIADKNAYQGAGLGLSISKAYVEMLGGEIWVESEPGKGSSFYFTIPYQTEKIKENSTKKEILSQVEETPINNLKILIVEDDETSEKLISVVIQQFACDIMVAREGKEAVEACLNNPDIDLVLMDILMPVMNGYEATRQIREFNKDVIIIAQTAYAMQGDKEKAIDSGCNDYLPKPIKANELLSLIKRYF